MRSSYARQSIQRVPEVQVISEGSRVVMGRDSGLDVMPLKRHKSQQLDLNERRGHRRFQTSVRDGVGSSGNAFGYAALRRP